jgi:radical SAM protein with 4Fe4S-binding SPASM domain
VRGGIQKRIAGFIREHPDISPALARFAIPDTFWKAGLHRILFRLVNYSFSRYQMDKQKDRVIGYPTHLFIDVTNICNLRCILCPTGVGAPGRKKGIMPLETFKKIVHEMQRYLISIDLFNWGEPLLNKQVYDMIRYAHKHHIVTSVSTNFNYFSEKSAEDLISSGLDFLILSIDGVSQETYEQYRVGGDFQKVMSNLSLLIDKRGKLGKKNPFVCWQFLVMRHNEHEVEIAKKMAEDLGVDTITIGHAYLPIDTRQNANLWLPKNPAYHRYNVQELEKIWEAQEIQQAQAPPNPTREHAFTEDLKRRVHCLWLWTQSTINWDGSISPCCAIYDPSDDFGTLSNNHFKKVWNNEKYRASRRFSSKGETSGIRTVCMRCPIAMNK